MVIEPEIQLHKNFPIVGGYTEDLPKSGGGALAQKWLLAWGNML